MKKTIILIIDVYQKIFSAVLKNILGINKMCRYSPTCSEYAKIAINQNGVLQGIQKSVIRILTCQPFAKS